MKKYLLLLVLPLFLTGCYHAQISTGLETSDQVYKKAWASSFIAGLIPPGIVHAEQHCTNGVARVETRHSFLNMIVQMITFSLYSPMEITVTCAASSADASTNRSQTIEVAKNSSSEVVIKSFSEAIQRSAESKEPAFVAFK